MAAIAAAADVSVPSVSKVLDGRPEVAAGTRVRVESALSELGVRPPPGYTAPAVAAPSAVKIFLAEW